MWERERGSDREHCGRRSQRGEHCLCQNLEKRERKREGKRGRLRVQGVGGSVHGLGFGVLGQS